MLAPRMLLGAAKVTIGSTHGRDSWGQQNLEEGSRRRAGCVSAGEGDNLCPGQLFPHFCPCQVSG